ncbi:MAG: amidohydrolase family protein [Acidobacteria bacterium]|nr:amidohydrolase family protein [Acidobacteriota bacterium]
MIRRLTSLCLGLLLLVPSAFAVPQASVDLVIENVTVIDGTGAAPRGPLDVLVADGKIVALEDTGTGETLASARRVDGTGRFLIPGLIDMHAHVSLGPVRMEMNDGVPAMRLEPEPAVPVTSFDLLLEHGVTTIRDPGGATEQVVALRDAQRRGDLQAPDMYVAGNVIDRTAFEGLTETFADETELRGIIRAQAAAGVDFVKLYVTLTPDLMAAAVDEAHRAGVKTVAHTLMTSWTDAAELGLDAIVHILPGSPELLPEAQRPAYMQYMVGGTQFMFTWFEYVDLDGPEITQMVEALVANDVTADPTLVMWETMVRGDDPEVVESPWLSRVPSSMLENWQTTFNMNPGWSAADFERGRAALPVALELAKRLHEAGVVLTAGTDANNPWVVPGASLHRELELLVEAGIPELEVLRIATHNGAQVLGELDQFGTVEPGKRADLVLLEADPSADIRATRRIAQVYQAGKPISR